MVAVKICEKRIEFTIGLIQDTSFILYFRWDWKSIKQDKAHIILEFWVAPTPIVNIT